MTSRRATAETPFAFTYGFEAKLLVEVLQLTCWDEEYNDESSKGLLRIEKNFLEERQEMAGRRMAEYQRSVTRYQNAQFRPRYFSTNDLLPRDWLVSKPLESGKIAKNWEGPYWVREFIQPKTYKTGDHYKGVDRWNVEFPQVEEI